MGCLYLEIEGQSCLVGSVDQGSMKNRQTDLLYRMTPKKSQKKYMFSSCFPIATFPGIFQQITPKKFANFLAKLSAFHCHRSNQSVSFR